LLHVEDAKPAYQYCHDSCSTNHLLQHQFQEKAMLHMFISSDHWRLAQESYTVLPKSSSTHDGIDMKTAPPGMQQSKSARKQLQLQQCAVDHLSTHAHTYTHFAVQDTSA
jgi:hypothetical protein